MYGWMDGWMDLQLFGIRCVCFQIFREHINEYGITVNPLETKLHFPHFIYLSCPFFPFQLGHFSSMCLESVTYEEASHGTGIGNKDQVGEGPSGHQPQNTTSIGY